MYHCMKENCLEVYEIEKSMIHRILYYEFGNNTTSNCSVSSFT